jgi:hypothetical protein
MRWIALSATRLCVKRGEDGLSLTTSSPCSLVAKATVATALWAVLAMWKAAGNTTGHRPVATLKRASEWSST